MTRKHAPDLSRRRALSGMAGLGVALPVLAACGGDDEPTTATDPASSSSGQPSAGSPGGSAGASEEPFAPTSDIEVGGGAIYPDEQVVITQPSEGEFKGFSAVCTHQGCTVSDVSAEGIVCACHGSLFSVDDGAPLDGPASSPLPEVALRVEGGQVFLA